MVDALFFKRRVNLDNLLLTTTYNFFFLELNFYHPPSAMANLAYLALDRAGQYFNFFNINRKFRYTDTYSATKIFFGRDNYGAIASTKSENQSEI